MSRTVSARIPKELHEKLRDKCKNLGCSINDYLTASIELCLNDYTNFDFGDEDEGKTDSVIPEKPKKVHEGKAPVLHFHWENGKLVQDEATWEEIPKTEENTNKSN